MMFYIQKKLMYQLFEAENIKAGKIIYTQNLKHKNHPATLPRS